MNLSASSGTRVVEEVLMGRGGERRKVIELRTQASAIHLAHRVAYIAPKISFVIVSIVINHNQNFGVNRCKTQSAILFFFLLLVGNLLNETVNHVMIYDSYVI